MAKIKMNIVLNLEHSDINKALALLTMDPMTEQELIGRFQNCEEVDFFETLGDEVEESEKIAFAMSLTATMVAAEEQRKNG